MNCVKHILLTDYQSLSNMYKKLSETKDAVNEARVDSIIKILSKKKELSIIRLKMMQIRLK